MSNTTKPWKPGTLTPQQTQAWVSAFRNRHLERQRTRVAVDNDLNSCVADGEDALRDLDRYQQSLESADKAEPVPLVAQQHVNPFGSMDASVWAQSFTARFGGDEGLMLTWFANAIMTGHDNAHKTVNRQRDIEAVQIGVEAVNKSFIIDEHGLVIKLVDLLGLLKSTIKD